MKILISIRHSPARHYLVTLDDQPIIDEILKLISESEHSKAITTAFSQGYFEREIAEHEIPSLKTDAILTEEAVRWDLMK